MSHHTHAPAELNRRLFLTAAGVGLGSLALSACTRSTPATGANAVDATAITAAEAARPHTGRTVDYTLTPQSAEIDLGGLTARTLVYGDTVPGTPLRANAGDELVVAVSNRLDHPTSVHWHGIALRNDMDGAPPASPLIAPGQSFTYRFSVPHSGTYWAHPHAAGVDTDYGLYVPVIVDDPREAGNYDAEWIVVLDDWTDGVGKNPSEILSDLRSGGMGSMGHGVGTSDLLGGDAGDTRYPYYLINGHVPRAATTFRAKPGQRVRMRIINAGADTAFRVALADHTMTVTHTDGFPIEPVQVDALLLGMGERYDVVVTVKDGVFPLVAMAEGKSAQARAVLNTGAGSTAPLNYLPAELGGRIGTVDDFTAAETARLSPGRPDLNLDATLAGNMMDYNWTINGRSYEHAEALTIGQGQRARLTFTNMSMMWHPMHLHGHTFQVVKPDGSAGPRKDTVIVGPMRTLPVDLIADNPGQWMLHCHNGYHMDSGMMTRLDYTT